MKRFTWTPWRLAGLAFALDVVFVLGWWAAVYRPGEQRFVATELAPMRWGDDRVDEVEVLAPGGYALVRAAASWHLVASASLAPGDLRGAAAAPGSLEGELVAAVFIPAQQRAVVLTEDDDTTRAFTWPLGQAPSPLEVPVPDAPWIDAEGALRDRTELKPAAAEDGVRYAAGFMVAHRRRTLVVLSRDDGRKLQEWGKVDRVLPRPESSTLVYETGASSFPRQLLCDAEGTTCARHRLSVGWRHDATSVAFRDEEDLFVACREGEVVLFLLGAERGLYLGHHPVAGGCEEVGWLPGGELYVEGGERLSLWGLAPGRGGRP